MNLVTQVMCEQVSYNSKQLDAINNVDVIHRQTIFVGQLLPLWTEILIMLILQQVCSILP